MTNCTYKALFWFAIGLHSICCQISHQEVFAWVMWQHLYEITNKIIFLVTFIGYRLFTSHNWVCVVSANTCYPCNPYESSEFGKRSRTHASSECQLKFKPRTKYDFFHWNLRRAREVWRDRAFFVLFYFFQAGTAGG